MFFVTLVLASAAAEQAPDCRTASCALQQDLQEGYTQLLQADKRAVYTQKAKATVSSRMTARHKVRGDILASLNSLLLGEAAPGGPKDPGDVYSPYETEFTQSWQWVVENKNVSTEDPGWDKAYSTFQMYLKTNNWHGMQYALLAEWGEYEKFAQKSCYILEAGNGLDKRGIMADAYYCGAQHLGIDWSTLTNAGYELADLCSAKVGTSMDPEIGVCGRVGKRQLLLNFVETVELWAEDGVYINIPSLDCIMDLVDADIYYCQTCADHCEHKPEHELPRP